MSRGLDANNHLTDYAGHLKQDGYDFVGRYINPGKAEPLNREEASALTAAGLWIVSIWEQGNPTSREYFGVTRGHQDGMGALYAAQQLGQPIGTPVYFAVDYDADDVDVVTITDYFRAVREVLTGAGYSAGVYGSGMICQHLSSVGYVSHTWLSQSKDWHADDYADWLPHADIVQGEETTVRGLDVDLNSSNGNAGGWQLAIA